MPDSTAVPHAKPSSAARRGRTPRRATRNGTSAIQATSERFHGGKARQYMPADRRTAAILVHARLTASSRFERRSEVFAHRQRALDTVLVEAVSPVGAAVVGPTDSVHAVPTPLRGDRRA